MEKSFVRVDIESGLIQTEQWIGRPIENVFDFFSQPHNLEKITPAFLNFRVLSMSTPKIQEGTRIDYRLKLHGFPVKWASLIEDWKPPFSFVDTQLKGPYRFWHHQHLFVSKWGGTLIADRVQFKIPAGWIGRLALGTVIRHDLERIFTHRQKVISEHAFSPSA